jgi:integrase
MTQSQEPPNQPEASRYLLSVEQASELFSSAGTPRSPRTIMRYCAGGHLDAIKVDTDHGEKYLISPESIDRRIDVNAGGKMVQQGGVKVYHRGCGKTGRNPGFPSVRLLGLRGGLVAGRRVYGSKTIHGTKKQAERALREVLARQDRGYAVPSPSRIPTLREYVKTWKQGEAAARLRARTLRDYLAILDRHVLPKLGEARLDAIHTARIEIEVVKPLREAGKVRSAQLAVAVLSKVLGSAVKDPTWGLVGNACRGVEVGRKPRRELRPLDAAERAAFREAIRGTEHEALWLLMMLTGLGPGEALGLGWDHLDLEVATLRVARTVECKARTIVEDTKRPSRKRLVPLVPELRALLRERWMAARIAHKRRIGRRDCVLRECPGSDPLRQRADMRLALCSITLPTA